MLFPSEIWIKIKSYEQQIQLYETLNNELKILTYYPVYLNLEQFYNIDSIFNLINKKYVYWYYYFTKESIYTTINHYITNAKEIYYR